VLTITAIRNVFYLKIYLCNWGKYFATENVTVYITCIIDFQYWQSILGQPSYLIEKLHLLLIIQNIALLTSADGNTKLLSIDIILNIILRL